MDYFADKNVFVHHRPHEGKEEYVRGVFIGFVTAGGQNWLMVTIRGIDGDLHGQIALAVDRINSIQLDPTEYRK